MKICIVGNSHIAALKEGLSHSRYAAEAAIDWFGVPDKGFRDGLLVGRTIEGSTPAMRQFFASTSGGRESIELDAYEAFVIVGAANLTNVLHIYSKYRTYLMKPQQGTVAISSELFYRLVVARIEQSGVLRMARQIKSLVQVPIYLIPAPMRVCASPKNKDPVDLSYGKLAEKHVRRIIGAIAKANGDSITVANIYDRVLRTIAASGIRVLKQPSSTVVDHIFTHEEYTMGSKRLLGHAEHPERDLAHMNKEYGALVIDMLFRELLGVRETSSASALS